MELNEKRLEEVGTVYKPSSPYTARVVSNERLTPEGSPDDIRHLIIDIGGAGIRYKEGQSVGIVPPGADEKGKRHRVRLYSIASAREGEENPDHLALTVKRVVYQDEESGKTVYGLASNYICDLKENENVEITGPVGRTFLLPEDPKTNLVMIAVGTGIAPFRAFIHHIYAEVGSWEGDVVLFFGAKTGLESIYMNDLNNDISQYYEEKTFKAFQALSREGTKKYVQHSVAENIETIWKIVKEGNFSLYICGLKDIEGAVEEVFLKKAKQEGEDWDSLRQKYKEEKRWHVEVY